MRPFREYVDMAVNFSGGAYVGISTLVINGMAIAEYASGKPSYILGPDGKNIIYVIHEAPQWYVGTIGIYTVILSLFWLGKPINTIVEARAAKTADPAAPKVGG
jgi:hypothetical protein